jgi:RNA polymerase sigma-70 factor, ECF subfamily
MGSQSTAQTIDKTTRLDQPALVEIYEQNSPKLYRYAFHLLGDADLAEECVSETFSRLLQSLKNGGGPGENVQAYLYRIAHNWATDHYRRRAPDEALEPEQHVDPVNNPSTLVTRQLERERVRQALLLLTREQRQVIVLRFLEDWPHERIATVIGKTAEATRALQHRALAALRGTLHEQEA